MPGSVDFLGYHATYYRASRKRVTTLHAIARTMNRPAEIGCPVNGAQMSAACLGWWRARFSGRLLSARPFMAGVVGTASLCSRDRLVRLRRLVPAYAEVAREKGEIHQQDATVTIEVRTRIERRSPAAGRETRCQNRKVDEQDAVVVVRIPFAQETKLESVFPTHERKGHASLQRVRLLHAGNVRARRCSGTAEPSIRARRRGAREQGRPAFRRGQRKNQRYDPCRIGR